MKINMLAEHNMIEKNIMGAYDSEDKNYISWLEEMGLSDEGVTTMFAATKIEQTGYARIVSELHAGDKIYEIPDLLEITPLQMVGSPWRTYCLNTQDRGKYIDLMFTLKDSLKDSFKAIRLPKDETIITYESLQELESNYLIEEFSSEAARKVPERTASREDYKAFLLENIAPFLLRFPNIPDATLAKYREMISFI